MIDIWLYNPLLPQLSSLSIEEPEDAELAYTMRDLPPTPPPRGASVDQNTTPGCHTPVVDREPEGTGLEMGRPPHTPGGTPLLSRTKRAPLEGEFEPLQLRKYQLTSMGSRSMDSSPQSRPRSPWGHFDPYDSAEDMDREYVGFATLPNQVHRKSVKKGFAFTLMVAGESGLGKSTLVNSLYLTDLYNNRKVLNAEERIAQTVFITKHTVGIEEKGVRLRLSIVDTPGFGDAVNNTESWKEIEDYIDQQFEQYFRDESGLNRKNIQDNRVHCCLYFISPFGHGLRPLDVECMRALHEKVNIVPVLAKADSLTPTEVRRKKMKIREEMEKFGINIYQFPDCDFDEDEEFKQQEQLLKVTSDLGRAIRASVLEDPAHSDFLLLRNMLVKTHMQDLKDVTRETHYENYRAQCIQNMTRMVVQERKRSLRDKIRSESSVDFPMTPLPLAPVDRETERLIWEKDEELRRMQEVLERIQEQMQQGQKPDY
uniref:Septin 4a n=1 Tax=Salmo trutta TaxID=8032 RepID=A0A673XF69_SALTR